MERRSIETLRTERGWSRPEFGRRVGVTEMTVYNWERRTHEPKASQLRTIAEVFGVAMESIDFEPDPSRLAARRERNRSAHGSAENANGAGPKPGAAG